MSDDSPVDSCGLGSPCSPQALVHTLVEGVYDDFFFFQEAVVREEDEEVDESESSGKVEQSDEQIPPDGSPLSLSLSGSSSSSSSSSRNSCATISSLFEKERKWDCNQNRHEERGQFNVNDPMPLLSRVSVLSRSNSDAHLATESSHNTTEERGPTSGEQVSVYEFDQDQTSQPFYSPPRQSPTLLGPRISGYEEEVAECSKLVQSYILASAQSPKMESREFSEIANGLWNNTSNFSTLYVCNGVSPLPSLSAWRLSMTKAFSNRSPVAVTPVQLLDGVPSGDGVEDRTSYRKALLFPSYPPEYTPTQLLLSFDQGATASTETCYEPELSPSTSSVNISEAAHYMLDFTHFHEKRDPQHRVHATRDELSGIQYDWNDLYRVYETPSTGNEAQSPLARMSTSAIGPLEELHCDPYTFGINTAIHASELGFGEQPSIRLINDIAGRTNVLIGDDTGAFPWTYGDIGNVSWSQISPTAISSPSQLFSPQSPFRKERSQTSRPQVGPEVVDAAVGGPAERRGKNLCALADSSDLLRSFSRDSSPSQTRLKVLSLTVETMAVAAATIQSSVAAQAKLYMRVSTSDTNEFSGDRSLLPSKFDDSFKAPTPAVDGERSSLPGSHPHVTDRSCSIDGKLDRIRLDVLGVPTPRSQERSAKDTQKETVRFLFRDYLDTDDLAGRVSGKRHPTPQEGNATADLDDSKHGASDRKSANVVAPSTKKKQSNPRGKPLEQRLADSASAPITADKKRTISGQSECVDRVDAEYRDTPSQDVKDIMYEYWSGMWDEEEERQRNGVPAESLPSADRPTIVPANVLLPHANNTGAKTSIHVTEKSIVPVAKPAVQSGHDHEVVSNSDTRESQISNELEEYLQCVQHEHTHRIAEARRMASGTTRPSVGNESLDSPVTEGRAPRSPEGAVGRNPELQVSGVRAIVELTSGRQCDPVSLTPRTSPKGSAGRAQEEQRTPHVLSSVRLRLLRKQAHCNTHSQELSERKREALPPTVPPHGAHTPTTTALAVQSSQGSGKDNSNYDSYQKLRKVALSTQTKEGACVESSSLVRSVMVMVTRQAGPATQSFPDARISLTTEDAKQVGSTVRVTAHNSTSQSHAYVVDEFVDYNIEAKNTNHFKSAQLLALREKFLLGCNAALLLGGTSSADMFSWIAVREIVDDTFAVMDPRSSMAVAMYTVRGGLVEDLFSSDSRLETLSTITTPVFGNLVRNVSYMNIGSSKEFSTLLGTVLARVSEVRSHSQGILFLSLMLSQPDAQDDAKVSSLLVSHAGSSPSTYRGILAKNPYEPLELFSEALGGACHTVCLFTYSLNDLGMTALMEIQEEMRKTLNAPCEQYRLIRATAAAMDDTENGSASTFATHNAMRYWLASVAAYTAHLSYKKTIPNTAGILNRLNERLNAERPSGITPSQPTPKNEERGPASTTTNTAPNGKGSSSTRASTNCTSPLVATYGVQHRDESCLTNSSAVPSQSVSCAMESSSLPRDEVFSATKLFDERLGLAGPPPPPLPLPSVQSSPTSPRATGVQVTNGFATASASLTQTPQHMDEATGRQKQTVSRSLKSEAHLSLESATPTQRARAAGEGGAESYVDIGAREYVVKSSERRLGHSRESSDISRTDYASVSTRSGPPTSTSSVAGNFRAPMYANKNNSWKGRVARLALMQEKHVEAAKHARRHHGRPTPPPSSQSDTTTAPASENFLISPTTSGSLPYTPALTEKMHISSETSGHRHVTDAGQPGAAPFTPSSEHECSATLLTASNDSTQLTESTSLTALAQNLPTPQCVTNSTRYAGLENVPTSTIQFISFSNEGSVTSTSPALSLVAITTVPSSKAVDGRPVKFDGKTTVDAQLHVAHQSRKGKQQHTVCKAIEGGNDNCNSARTSARDRSEQMKCKESPASVLLRTPEKEMLIHEEKRQDQSSGAPTTHHGDEGSSASDWLLMDNSSETSGLAKGERALNSGVDQSTRVRTLVIADPCLEGRDGVSWEERTFSIQERRDGSVHNFPVDEIVERPDGSEEIASDTLDMVFDVLMSGCNASILASDTRGSAMSAVALKGIVQKILDAGAGRKASSSSENESARASTSSRDTASGARIYLTASIAQVNGQMVTDLLVESKYPQKLNVCVSPVCGTYIRDISELPVLSGVAFDTMLTTALSHAGAQVGSYSVGMVVAILILRIKRRNMDVSVSNLTVSFAGEYAGQYTAVLDDRLIVPRPLFHYSFRGPCFTVSLVGISRDARRAEEMLACQQQLRSVVKPPVQPMKLMKLVKHLTERIHLMSKESSTQSEYVGAPGTALGEAPLVMGVEQLRHLLKEAMAVLEDIKSPLPLMMNEDDGDDRRVSSTSARRKTGGSPAMSITIRMRENLERTAAIKSVAAVEIRAGGNGRVAARDNTILMEADGTVVGVPVSEAVVHLPHDTIRLPSSLNDLVNTFVSGCNAALLAADGHGCAATLSYFQVLATAVMREVENIRISPDAANCLRDEGIAPARHANLYMSIALVQDNIVVDLIKPKEAYSRYDVTRSPLFGRCLQGVIFENIHDAVHLCEVYKSALSLAEPAFSQKEPGMFVLEFVLTQTTNSQVSDVLVSSLLATTVFDQPEVYSKILRRVEGEPHQLFETALSGPCMTVSLFSMTDMEADASKLLRVQSELSTVRTLKPTKCSIAELMEKCSKSIVELSEERPRAVEQKRANQIDNLLEQMQSMVVQCEEMLRSPGNATFSSGL